MQNYSDDFFFKKELKIWQNAPTTVSNKQAFDEINALTDCSFFPEGGNMVAKLASRLGFKAVNKFGCGVDVEGLILSDGKDTVALFKSEHLGMGLVSFKPEFGKNYVAKVKTSDGKVMDFKLPKVEENGFVIAIDNISNKNNIKFYVNNSNPQTADKAQDLVVIGQQRGKICFTAKVPNTKSAVTFSVAKQEIPDDGIVQITLFNPDGTPLCERLIFSKKQEQQVILKVKTDKNDYSPREKVTVTVEATDSLGKPVQGNFSLSATDGKQVMTPQYNGNIASYLLLTSDLKGYVEDPAYYFTPKDFAATRHLDLLLMTQGWRRFAWTDVMAGRYPRVDYIVEQGINVIGRAVRPNKKPSPNAQMTIFIQTKNSRKPMIDVGACDSNGRFGFYNFDFSDTCQLLVQAVKEKGGRNLEIVLDTTAFPAISTPKNFLLMAYFDAKPFAEFLKRTAENLEFEKKLRLNEERMLQTVEIKAKKTVKVDSRRIYGKADKSIVLTDQDCLLYQTVYDVIRQQVPGVQVTQEDFNFKATSRGAELKFAIDGFITDDAFVNSIRPCEVEAIDVLRGADAAIFGLATGGGGVINILLKTGAARAAVVTAPGVLTAKKAGYAIAREFYAPQYDVSKPEHDLPDFRATLHWQPTLKTDATGKATATFWNTDAVTKVQIQVEGFSNMGRVAVGKASYEVD